MPRSITKTIYTFRELLVLRKEGKTTKKAVHKAKNWLIEGQTDHDWWRYFHESWKKALNQIGHERGTGGPAHPLELHQPVMGVDQQLPLLQRVVLRWVGYAEGGVGQDRIGPALLRPRGRAGGRR